MELLKKIYIFMKLSFLKIYYRTTIKKELASIISKIIAIDDNDIVIFYPYSIGDVFNLSLFITEYKKKNNYKNIHLFVSDYISDLSLFLNMFGVDFLRTYDKNLHRKLTLVGSLINKKKRYLILNHSRKDFKVRKNILFIEYFPYLLKLNIDDENIKRILKNTYLKINKDRLNSTRITKVLLILYAGTLKNVDLKYWENISCFLKNYGLEVYTNISSSNQESISNTSRLDLTLNKLIKFVDSNTLVIARRNGLNDVFSIFPFINVLMNPDYITNNATYSYFYDLFNFSSTNYFRIDLDFIHYSYRD